MKRCGGNRPDSQSHTSNEPDQREIQNQVQHQTTKGESLLRLLEMIGLMGPKARGATPELMEILRSNDQAVVAGAKQALGSICPSAGAAHESLHADLRDGYEGEQFSHALGDGPELGHGQLR